MTFEILDIETLSKILIIFGLQIPRNAARVNSRLNITNVKSILSLIIMLLRISQTFLSILKQKMAITLSYGVNPCFNSKEHKFLREIRRILEKIQRNAWNFKQWSSFSLPLVKFDWLSLFYNKNFNYFLLG